MSRTLAEDLRARIEAVSYDSVAVDLVRFRDSANDDRVAPLVRELTVTPFDDRREVLSHGDLPEDTVRVFAERRTLTAHRTNSLGLALEALDARMVLPPWEFEIWRRSALYSLFVASELGAQFETVLSSAMEIGGEGLVSIMGDVIENLVRVGDLSDVGRIEVETSYGIGVLRTEMPRPDRTWFFGRAPTLMKPKSSTYVSETNLADSAVRIADAFETRAGLTAHDLMITELPGNVIGGTEFTEDVEVFACLTFNVFDEGAGTDVLECYVAELVDDAIVSDLVEAINDAEPGEVSRAAVGAGRQLAVMIEVPVYDFSDDAMSDDDAELEAGGSDLMDLEPYVERASVALSHSESDTN